MIGFVTPKLLATLRLQIASVDSQTELDIVVDTGFNGALTLTAETIKQLNLRAAGEMEVVLADGSAITAFNFEAWVQWGEGRVRVVAQQTTGEALIGMALLQNHELTVEVRDGGRVLIEPIY